MTSIKINEMRNSAVLRIYSDRNLIQQNPVYQRMGGIWGLETRQLLIDTILNDLDMPKIYLHELNEPRKIGEDIYKYAIIDGRQRLETLWGFINGDFALADDFEFFDDPSVKAGGLTYGDLAAMHPSLKTRIDSHTLPIMLVTTDDLDMIEEMFSRLNDASPLNAAEKRNALGGPMAQAIRESAGHKFFAHNVPFANKRYQHLEVAAKFLLLMNDASDRISDSKKAYLDKLVRDHKEKGLFSESIALQKKVENVLDRMTEVFIQADPLLRTQAMTVIYDLVFKNAELEGWLDSATRQKFLRFEQEREKNRKIAEEDITKATYELLEFDRMHLQGSNDSTSIRSRLDTLKGFLLAKNHGA